MGLDGVSRWIVPELSELWDTQRVSQRSAWCGGNTLGDQKRQEWRIGVKVKETHRTYSGGKKWVFPAWEADCTEFSTDRTSTVTSKTRLFSRA